MAPTNYLAYNFGVQIDITTSDVNPNDGSTVTIGPTAFKPQKGATSFLSPFGFILDYAEGYNGNDAYDAGNLVGFPRATQPGFFNYYEGTYNLIVFAYERATWKYSDQDTEIGTGPPDGANVYKGKCTVSRPTQQQLNQNLTFRGCNIDSFTLDLLNNGTNYSHQYGNDTFGNDTISGPERKCEGTFINFDNTNPSARDTTTIVFNGKDTEPSTKSLMISFVSRSSNDITQTNTYTIFYAYGVIVPS
jgi:hypothetical protein